MPAAGSKSDDIQSWIAADGAGGVATGVEVTATRAVLLGAGRLVVVATAVSGSAVGDAGVRVGVSVAGRRVGVAPVAVGRIAVAVPPGVPLPGGCVGLRVAMIVRTAGAWDGRGVGDDDRGVTDTSTKAGVAVAIGSGVHCPQI
jgi:hypothetical protein